MEERDVIRFIAEGLTNDKTTIRELRSVAGFRQLKKRIQLFKEYKGRRLGFSQPKKSTERPAAKAAEQGGRREGHGRCLNAERETTR